MNESQGEGIYVSANVGTILIGSMNFIGALLAYFTVNNFGRVSVLIKSHFMMAAIHWVLAVCIIYEYNFAALMLILAFILIF